MALLDMLPTRKEQRATFKDADGWLADVFRGGRRTVSGEAVGPNSAMSLSAYYAAIRNISEDVGKMPVDIIQRSVSGGKRAKLRKHPAYKLLNVQPNTDMTPIALRESTGHHAMGWGDGLQEIVRTRGGVPVEMWPMDPAKVEIEHETDDSGRQRLVYVQRNIPGESDVRLPADKVFHLHGLSFDGIHGYSFAKIAREAIGAGLAQVKAGAALFGNGIRPDAVLTVPGKLPLDAQVALREGWEEQYQGTENRHKLAILHAGATLAPFSVNPEDAQWIQSMQFTVEEMARVSRIPLSKLQSLVHSNNNTLVMENMGYHTDTLLSWIIRWEQEIKLKLIGVEFDDVQAKFNANAILRADIATRFKAYSIGRQWGWLSANNVLEKEDQDGIGEQGDIHMIPANMLDASKINEPAPASLPAPSGDIIPAADTDDSRTSLARGMAIRDRVRDQLAEARNTGDAVHRIISSHGPPLRETVMRIESKKGGKKGDRAAVVTPWLYAVGISAVDSAWCILMDAPKPEGVDSAVAEWSRSSADRLLGVNGGIAVNEVVTSELGHLTRLAFDILGLDAERAQEN